VGAVLAEQTQAEAIGRTAIGSAAGLAAIGLAIKQLHKSGVRR
jgi:hypothetical protein